MKQSVVSAVNTIRNHPLVPEDVNVYGYIMDSVTGEVNEVK